MGRWSYSNRLTVEECKSISTKFLNQYNYFNGGVRSGGMNWTRNGEQTGNIGFTVSTVEGDECIRFMYAQTDNSTGEKTELTTRRVLNRLHVISGGAGQTENAGRDPLTKLSERRYRGL